MEAEMYLISCGLNLNPVLWLSKGLTIARKQEQIANKTRTQISSSLIYGLLINVALSSALGLVCTDGRIPLRKSAYDFQHNCSEAYHPEDVSMKMKYFRNLIY